MRPGDLGLLLLVGAVVVIAAIAAARIAHGVGLPSLLVFLGLAHPAGLPAARRGDLRAPAAG
jgi:NhaP-type Na+/H+ and K+/H+ antiporter